MNVNDHVDAAHLLREECDLNDNDPAFEDSFFTKYQNQPVELEALNAVEVCRWFNLKWHASAHFHACLHLLLKICCFMLILGDGEIICHEHQKEVVVRA